MEIHADALFKATKVEGVYDRDPVRFPDASMYANMTFDRFLSERIGVMDSTAVTLCRDNHLKIRVFGLATARGTSMRVVFGEPIGTIVSDQLDGSPARLRAAARGDLLLVILGERGRDVLRVEQEGPGEFAHRVEVGRRIQRDGHVRAHEGDRPHRARAGVERKTHHLQIESLLERDHREDVRDGQSAVLGSEGGRTEPRCGA